MWIEMCRYNCGFIMRVFECGLWEYMCGEWIDREICSWIVRFTSTKNIFCKYMEENSQFYFIFIHFLCLSVFPLYHCLFLFRIKLLFILFTWLIIVNVVFIILIIINAIVYGITMFVCNKKFFLCVFLIYFNFIIKILLFML